MSFPIETMRFLAAVGGTVAIAALAGPLLPRPGLPRLLALAGGVGSLVAAPLVIPADAAFLRFLAAILAFAIAAKMLAYARSSRHLGPAPPGARDYLRFLADPFTLTFDTRPAAPRDAGRADAAWRLAIAAPCLAATVALFWTLVATDVTRSSFLLDHVVKVLSLGLAIDAGVQVFYAVGRLAGLDAVLIAEFGFLSASPADFWRRYNRLVGEWLRRIVFLPAGGLRRPIRATLLTFLVSGIAHEALFALVTGEVRGYQTFFFLVQGVGVAASVPLGRRFKGARWAGAASRAVTIPFMLLTAIPFFASFARIVPGFYSAEPWLP